MAQLSHYKEVNKKQTALFVDVIEGGENIFIFQNKE